MSLDWLRSKSRLQRHAQTPYRRRISGLELDQIEDSRVFCGCFGFSEDFKCHDRPFKEIAKSTRGVHGICTIIPSCQDLGGITRDPGQMSGETVIMDWLTYLLRSNWKATFSKEYMESVCSTRIILQTLNTCRPVTLNVVVVLWLHWLFPAAVFLLGARDISSPMSKPSHVLTTENWKRPCTNHSDFLEHWDSPKMPIEHPNRR